MRSKLLQIIRFAAVAAAVVFGIASSCLADTLWVRSSSGKPIPYNKVKIEKIAKGELGEELFFLSENGAEGHRPLDQIVQIKSDEDPVLSAAEEAFASNNMKAAAEGYRKLSTSGKPWIQRRAGQRLAEAASKGGDFVGAVMAFIETTAKDPADAAKVKPDLAAIPPDQLDAAIVQCRSAANSAPASQRQVLLPFLAELYTAKKDMASAEKVVRQMSQAPASGGTASVEAQRARGDVAIGAAREAMSSRRYGQVVTAIQSNSAAFTEPRQQADALYLLAQAKEAMATDDPGLKDAAIAYMRVAANFKSAPDAPHVADSLLNTAKIEEKLNQPKSALALYGQIAAEYKGTAAGKAAEESAQRLGAAGK